MADGRIEIDTAINTDGAEKGVKSLTGKLKQLGGGSTMGGITKLAGAIPGIGIAFLGVSKAIGAVTSQIKQMSEAFDKQKKAEVQLQTAIKNNPYVDSTAYKALSQFASEIQGFTEYGDEELLPLMASLNFSGRTQAETMEIMTAAVDVAASGVMSLDSAVKYLNGSYNGLAGELGERIPQVKNLTAEEMKSGEAVKLVGEMYKGTAKEVADATGGTKQLSNALGDFKEEIGAMFAKPVNSVKKFFAEIVGGWASALKAQRDYMDALEKAAKGSTESDALEVKIAAYTNKIKQSQDAITGLQKSYDKAVANQEKAYKKVTKNGKRTLDELSDQDRQYYRQFVDATNEIAAGIEKERKKIDEYKDAITKARVQITENEDSAKATVEQQKLDAEIAARDKLRAEYDATISAKEKEIAIRKAAGEEISRETEAQELYNTALGAYVKMMSDPAFEGNSGNYEHEVKAREYIGDQADIIKTKETEEAYRELSEQIQATADDGAKSIREQYDALIEELEKEFERVTGLELSDDGSIANIEDANARELELYQQLQDAKVRANEEANEKIKQENADSLASNAELVNSFITQFADITGQMTNLMRENLNAETAKETADLDQQYSDGLISYEEYCDKKAEIDKKAAREEYKIKMIEWTMQLATAAANIAEGMTKALAQNGYPLGAIMAGLAAASGALQIATIVANKPKPPAFATGGIVGGNSYTGDNVIARVNSGERILTQAQSKALENSIASLGSGGGGVSMNVKIINNASDEVRAQSQLDMDGLKITVDKLVNTSFQQGNYTDSMNIAQSRQNGVKLL